MKYYSEETRKFYDTAEACAAAENELVKKQNLEKIEKEKRAAERKNAANEVEAARQVMIEAQSTYKKKLEEFCKKYGSYHYTSKSVDDIPHLFDIFNLFT